MDFYGASVTVNDSRFTSSHIYTATIIGSTAIGNFGISVNVQTRIKGNLIACVVGIGGRGRLCDTAAVCGSARFLRYCVAVLDDTVALYRKRASVINTATPDLIG